jgi:GMP synthase (glutamine-hydrolysing)
LLGPLAPSFEAFQWHSYEFPRPPGAVALARSEVCLQAARVGETAWAIQFHPEVTKADALHWTADYQSDPDAVRIGIDPTALALEIEAKIDAFNELGRGICRRWLDFAAARRD